MFPKVDNYTEYESLVVNQYAGEILAKKNKFYSFKEFYSSGNIELSNYNLLNHYLSLVDIACLTSEDKDVDTCASLHINDMTSIANVYNKKIACNVKEYGNSNKLAKVRVLNYDYIFKRACVNVSIKSIKLIENNKYLLSLKNDAAVHTLMLLRPMYLTTSLSYLYQINYDTDRIYYNEDSNNPKMYKSYLPSFNIIVNKVTNNAMYNTDNLINIDQIFEFEARNMNKQCSIETFTEEKCFPASFTLYYLDLFEKIADVNIDITNSMTMYFSLDTNTKSSNSVLYEIRRSSPGSSVVCKAFEVRYMNDENIKYLSITLNNMNSMTYIIKLPDAVTTFDIFICYSLDIIQAYAFYKDCDCNKYSYNYALFETSLVSSWSTTDIAKYIDLYKCKLPAIVFPANSLSIPSMYELATKMKLI